MTDADRELIELAAKAYGLQVKGWVGNKLKYFNPVTGFGDWDQQWNPLENDGDAFRLAVSLDIDIRFYRKHVDAQCDSRAGTIFRDYSKDRNAATRSAIVRAAAEIGRGMG